MKKALAVIFLLTCVTLIGAMTMDHDKQIKACHAQGGQIVHTGGGNIRCLIFHDSTKT